MSSCLGFLVRFVAASSAAFCLWEIFSKWYLHTVVPVANSLLATVQLPVQLEQRAGLLLYVYTRVDGSILRVQALDYDSVYLNLIAVASLFVATPGARIKWKLKWIGAVWVFLWATHVASFYAGGQIAIWQYLTAVNGLGSTLATEMARFFPPTRQHSVGRILELWNVWARYAFGLGVWYLAFRHRTTSPTQPQRAPVRSKARRRASAALPVGKVAADLSQ